MHRSMMTVTYEPRAILDTWYASDLGQSLPRYGCIFLLGISIDGVPGSSEGKESARNAGD